MNKSTSFWVVALAALGSLGVASQAWAQPGVPAAPAPAAVPAVGAVPAGAPAAAPAKNLWSFLCLTPEQREQCRERCCRHPFGQLLAGAAGPAGLMTGGLITNKCAVPSAADLAKPADSAEGAAAKIKADEADAKARREAVRYLGTVDCHYWPEAEAALINALRADRNECVRFEAALVLNRGCCCTPKIMEALSLTVAGSERDGNPAETSDRVRAAAADALSHCTAFQPIVPEGEQQKEALPEPRKVQLTPSEYYKKVGQLPKEKVLENARQVLANVGVNPNTAAQNQQPSPAAQSRAHQGVFGLVSKAAVAPPAQGQSYVPAQAYTQVHPMPQLPPRQNDVPFTAPVNSYSPVPVPVQRVPNRILDPNQILTPAQGATSAPVTKYSPIPVTPEPEAVEGPVEPAANNASSTQRRPEGLFNILGRSLRR